MKRFFECVCYPPVVYVFRGINWIRENKFMAFLILWVLGWCVFATLVGLGVIG